MHARAPYRLCHDCSCSSDMASKLSNSRAGVLYICHCSRCKGAKAFSYSTVTRHEDVYGKHSDIISGSACEENPGELDSLID